MTAGPARLLNEGDCRNTFLITQGVLCLICADHGAGFSLQQSRMRLGNPLACHALRLPRCRTHAAAQLKPQKVAESGNMKMQPEPVYEADQALTDAGFKPRQARSLVRLVGYVVQPLALQSSVLQLESSVLKLETLLKESVMKLETSMQDSTKQLESSMKDTKEQLKSSMKDTEEQLESSLKALDYKASLIVICFIVEVSANPNSGLKAILARMLDLIKPVI